MELIFHGLSNSQTLQSLHLEGLTQQKLDPHLLDHLQTIIGITKPALQVPNFWNLSIEFAANEINDVIYTR